MVTLVTLVPVVPFRWFRSVVPGFTTCRIRDVDFMLHRRSQKIKRFFKMFISTKLHRKKMIRTQIFLLFCLLLLKICLLDASSE